MVKNQTAECGATLTQPSYRYTNRLAARRTTAPKQLGFIRQPLCCSTLSCFLQRCRHTDDHRWRWCARRRRSRSRSRRRNRSLGSRRSTSFICGSFQRSLCLLLLHTQQNVTKSLAHTNHNRHHHHNVRHTRIRSSCRLAMRAAFSRADLALAASTSTDFTKAASCKMGNMWERRHSVSHHHQQHCHNPCPFVQLQTFHGVCRSERHQGRT